MSCNQREEERFSRESTIRKTCHLQKTRHLILCFSFYVFYIFIKHILLIMILQLSHFSPLLPSPSTPIPSSSPPAYFMSVDHTYEFRGFSISFIIFNMPLSILYLPIMLLIPCIFSPIHLLHPSR